MVGLSPPLAPSFLDLVQEFVEESQRWEIELSDTKERMRPLEAPLQFPVGAVQWFKPAKVMGR